MLYYALLYGSNMPETVYTQVTGSEPSFMDEPVDSGLLTPPDSDLEDMIAENTVLDITPAVSPTLAAFPSPPTSPTPLLSSHSPSAIRARRSSAHRAANADALRRARRRRAAAPVARKTVRRTHVPARRNSRIRVYSGLDC